MRKIAIVVGHNSRARGAVRVTDGAPEFDWNGHLAELIQLHDPANIRVFRRVAPMPGARPAPSSYTSTQRPTRGPTAG